VAYGKKKHDPIQRFAALLRHEKMLTKEIEKEIQKQVETELNEALAFAEQSQWPHPEEALNDLFVNP
jgi:TPP-dependent pyruvate/acetoin dehydrogenase alpha subunit